MGITHNTLPPVRSRTQSSLWRLEGRGGGAQGRGSATRIDGPGVPEEYTSRRFVPCNASHRVPSHEKHTQRSSPHRYTDFAQKFFFCIWDIGAAKTTVWHIIVGVLRHAVNLPQQQVVRIAPGCVPLAPHRQFGRIFKLEI